MNALPVVSPLSVVFQVDNKQMKNAAHSITTKPSIASKFLQDKSFIEGLYILLSFCV